MRLSSRRCAGSPSRFPRASRSPHTMRRRSALYGLALGAGLVVLGSCKDSDLEVTNPNAGDTKRVLATPVDAENLLGNYFKRWAVAFYGGGNVGQAPPSTFEGMANVMSLQ